MKFKKSLGFLIAGAAAGAANGLLGAGGGMILVPLLTHLNLTEQEDVFPASVAIILPICIVSLLLSQAWQAFSWSIAIPYLLGSAGGGVLAGTLGRRIPAVWLHRILGVLILWGGIRNLC